MSTLRNRSYDIQYRIYYNLNSIENVFIPFSFLYFSFILKPQIEYTFLARALATLTFKVIL